jgi:predicted phage tail protein
MKTVYLHGDLGKKFVRKLKVDAITIPEIMWALECNLDGFFEHLLKLSREGTEYVMLSKRKSENKNSVPIEDVISPESFGMNYKNNEVHFICAIQGGGVITTIVTAIKGFTLVGFIKAVAISVAISFVMQALFKPPEPPKPGEQVSTKSFLLSGSQNKTSQGVPVPLGYGRMMVGSTVIDAKKSNHFLTQNTSSDLVLESYTNIEYIDLLCEGPIEGFVNQAGGAINGNDIREGIFLNGVPVKNPSAFVTSTRKKRGGFGRKTITTSSLEEGSFNFVLNEEEEMPEISYGADYEYKVLSDEVSYVSEYETLLYGPSPYANGDAKSEYDFAQDAVNNGAKKFTHAIRNQFVDKCIVTFAVQLSQNDDQGNTIKNSCRFSVYISKKGKPINILDLSSGVRRLKFIIKGEEVIEMDYAELRKIREIEQIEASKRASEFAAEKNTYVKVANYIRNFGKKSSKWGISSGKGFTKSSRINTPEGQIRAGIAYSNGVLVTNQELDIYLKWKNTDEVDGLVDITRESSLSSGPWGKLLTKLTNEQVAALSGLSSPAVRAVRNEELKKLSKDSSNIGINVSDSSYFIIEGIATAPYKFDIEIEFNPEENYNQMQGSTIITAVKLSSEYDPGEKSGVTHDTAQAYDDNKSHVDSAGGINKQRLLQLVDVQERSGIKFNYPHTALCKIKFDAKNFSKVPDRSYHLKLKKVLIPSNYDPISRKYKGPWNGFFKGQTIDGSSVNNISDEFRYWTDNPAWIFYDLVQNPRYGLGKYGLEEYNIDKWQLYKAAKYCDELVETRHPPETLTFSPRSCATNNNISNQEGDGEEGSFEISFHQNGFYDSNGTDIEYTSYSEGEFRKDFGEGVEFRGLKVAIFMYQHNFSESTMQQNNARQLVRKNSCVRRGEIVIEERVLKESNPAKRSVTVFGPSLEEVPSTFSINGGRRTLGAACLQKSYPVVEPRFTCSTYIHERGQALTVMNNLASVFRGIIGYDFGKILTLQDSKKNPILLFNNSNISREAGFSYAGMDKNKKFTSCLVRFNNKNKNYKPDLVYEEDASAMRVYGYQEKEIMGLGITSETQARRLARWVLYSSQLENEKISFTTSEEGSYLYPGAIFEVSDENRAGRNMSGRVLDISSFEDGAPYILIDKSARDFVSTSKVEFTVNVGLPFLTDKIIDGRASSHKSSEDQDAEIESYNTPQALKFQASIGVNENINKFGPQGQKTILSNLIVKIPFSVDLNKNVIKAYNHNLENGDRVRFISSGLLPAGLDKLRVGSSSYFVVNAGLHTFQVASTLNGDHINISDRGRDQFSNTGGLHYFAVESSTFTKRYIDQVEIGASYSLQGIFGSEITEQATHNPSDLENYFIFTSEIESDWYESLMFGTVNIPSDNGFIFSTSLGWIYIGSMNYARNDDNEFFWFWSAEFGWVSTTNNLYNQYWWSSNDQKWIYVKFLQTGSNFSPLMFFVFQENHNYSKNDIYSIPDGGDFSILHAASSGFWITSKANMGSSQIQQFLGVTPSEVEAELTLQDVQKNPAYHSAVISDWEKISSLNNDVTNMDALRIKFESGHGLDFFKNNKITIRDFDSSSSSLDDNVINKTWNIIFISNDEIELIDSSHAYSIFDVTINDKGSVEYIESIQNRLFRSFESQLFRVLSVKEVEDRKFEVNGMEYNDSKFDSVDKNLSIKMPALPIPPQADMSLPEPPENLVLTDLTI